MFLWYDTIDNRNYHIATIADSDTYRNYDITTIDGDNYSNNSVSYTHLTLPTKRIV